MKMKNNEGNRNKKAVGEETAERRPTRLEGRFSEAATIAYRGHHIGLSTSLK